MLQTKIANVERLLHEAWASQLPTTDSRVDHYPLKVTSFIYWENDVGYSCWVFCGKVEGVSRYTITRLYQETPTPTFNS